MDVAEFFGFDPFGLTEEQLLALQTALPRLEARRLRRGLELAPDVRLSVDQLYELTLAETEDRDLAEEAARRYMAAQLRAGQTPE